MKSIGVISDTHGLLRPEAIDALAGSDLIVHAGDIGNSRVLDELRELAPLTAIRGNIDKWATDMPDTGFFEVGGRYVYVLHDIKELDLDPVAAGIDVVVSGHSHKPGIHREDDVLYVNPGSAGPRRFTLPTTLAKLVITENGASAEIVDLLATDMV